MKCEYCDQERKKIETEEYEKLWVCNCDVYQREQELQKKIYYLERELMITHQRLSDLCKESIFAKEIIKLNETYGKHVLC